MRPQCAYVCANQFLCALSLSVNIITYVSSKMPLSKVAKKREADHEENSVKTGQKNMHSSTGTKLQNWDIQQLLDQWTPGFQNPDGSHTFCAQAALGTTSSHLVVLLTVCCLS